MNRINRISSLLKQKFKAMLLHSVLTLVISIISAGIVFFIWYPGQLSDLLNSTEIYLLVLLIEVCLGPLMSLVIFNPSKPRAELIRDYSLIGIIQISALAYGIHTTYIARPVYTIFVVDRIEVVSAFELEAADIQESSITEFQSLPALGIKQICVTVPENPQEKSDLIWSAIEKGKDIHLLPKYYRHCHDNEILSNAKSSAPLIELIKSNNQYSHFLEALPKQGFTWLPVHSSIGSWIEIYPKNKSASPYYINVNPFF